MGFAPSRAAARQLVTHGHFTVNGRPTNMPSYQLKAGDRVEVREYHREREPFKVAKETLRSHQPPEWLSIDAAKLSGAVWTSPAETRCRSTSTSSSWSSTTRGKPQIMIELESPQIEPVEELGTYAKYEAGPLPAGYGVTLGNALRRVLLSSLEGAAVTSIQLRDVYQEFSTIPGVKEDVTQIVLTSRSSASRASPPTRSSSGWSRAAPAR